MPKEKKTVRFFKICPETDEEQIRLNIFELLKRKKTFSIQDVKKASGVSKDFAAECINKWVKMDLVKISGTKKGPVKFNSGYKKILGIGFSGTEIILTVMDLSGKIISHEHIDIGSFREWKGRKKEVEKVIAEIKLQSKLLGDKFACIGLAIPEEMSLINPKSTDIISKGIRSIWKSDVFVAREAAAAGYGERDIGKKIFVEDVIYMHSDIGAGTVIKKEMISEASGQSLEESGTYLKPWNQFSIVRSSKELIEKGIGTDIVQMVGGDLDKVSLEIVLKAAGDKDELAEDLVKRSALALGVRVAYLVNMFNAENVILGGGTERKEGNFIKSVQERANRFIWKVVVYKVKIIPGVLGKKASSIGAACLCRRELFMEA